MARGQRVLRKLEGYEPELALEPFGNTVLSGVFTPRDARLPDSGGDPCTSGAEGHMLVRHFMTSDPFTFSPAVSCRDALQEMSSRRIRRAPVLEGKRMVGIVSERDLLRVLPFGSGPTGGGNGTTDREVSVSEAMTTNVYSVHPNDHLESVARLMLTRKIGGVPVVEEGILKGMITESDIFKALWGIFQVGEGCRLLFEAEDKQHDLTSYIQLFLEHHCQIHGLLRYQLQTGTSIYYACVVAPDLESLLRDLWDLPGKVLLVERD